jgi:hypothetical protein
MPSEQHWRWVMGEMQSIATLMANMGDFIGEVKPIWKQTWETELQTVVKEQQMLKKMEESLDTLTDDHVQVTNMIAQLQQVMDLKKAGIKREFEAPPKDGRHDGLHTVMQELVAVDSDSQRRLKAIEHQQKIRNRELEWKTDHPFHKELNKLTQGHLKKTGGVEELEREQERRRRAIIRETMQL